MDALSPSVIDAVAMLRATAETQVKGALAHQRLSEIDGQVRKALEDVESTLVAVVQAGAVPATDAAAHLLAAGGKRIRPLAVLLSARCCGQVTEPIREIASASELVHLATLLHDDVIDDADQRRGQIASRRVWGNAVSVLAGDLLLTHALERTQNCASQVTLRELLQALRKLVDGEVLQLRGRSRFDGTQVTYFQIIEHKTAALFVWAMRAGAREAGGSDEAIDALGNFGADLGMAFQLVDDVLDYAGEANMTGKSLFADLADGKATLPLIYALESNASLLAQVELAVAGDGEAAQMLAREVVATGAADRVRTLARQFGARAEQRLSGLPDTQARRMLAGIAAQLSARSC